MSENELIDNTDNLNAEYPPQTSRFLSWNAMKVIKAPPPNHLLLPVFLVFLLFSVVLLLGSYNGVIDSVDATGKILWRDSSDIRADTSGTINSPARSGIGQVKKGEEIANIDGKQKILAPRDGILVRRYFESGSLVNKGDLLGVVGNPSEGWVVRVDVEERDLWKIHPGQDVSIQLLNQNDFGVIPGKVVGELNHKNDLSGSAKYLISVEFSPSVRNWFEEHQNQVFDTRVDVAITTGKSTGIAVIQKLLFGRH